MKYWQQMTQDELKKYVPDTEGEIEHLQKKLEIAAKALKDIIKDYDINGPCEEDCVGFYMYCTAYKALKEMEEEE